MTAADDALDRLEAYIGVGRDGMPELVYTSALPDPRQARLALATVRDRLASQEQELQRLREENARQKSIIEALDECAQRVEGLRLPGGVTPIYTCRRAHGHSGPHSEFPVEWTENPDV